MRSIALDIETTGLSPIEGHKIIEIGCVELVNNFPTGRFWQKYINPQRSMPSEAFKIHGLSEDFLSDKPIFIDVAKEFLGFIKDSTLIIHNANFDLRFLNYELEAINMPPVDYNKNKVIDTIDVAKKIFPGQSVSLDALCRRYKINIERKNHGALLDAELLTEVFLEMHGGRQQFINLSSENKNENNSLKDKKVKYSRKIYELTQTELENHKKLIDFINKF